MSWLRSETLYRKRQIPQTNKCPHTFHTYTSYLKTRESFSYTWRGNIMWERGPASSSIRWLWTFPSITTHSASRLTTVTHTVLHSLAGSQSYQPSKCCFVCRKIFLAIWYWIASLVIFPHWGGLSSVAMTVSRCQHSELETDLCLRLGPPSWPTVASSKPRGADLSCGRRWMTLVAGNNYN